MKLSNAGSPSWGRGDRTPRIPPFGRGIPVDRRGCYVLLKKLAEFADTYEVRALVRRRVEPAVTASAFSVTLVFFFWLVLHVGGNNGVRYFDDIVTALAALSACVACLLAGRRRSGSERHFWMLLGLALGAWTFAEVIWGSTTSSLEWRCPCRRGPMSVTSARSHSRQRRCCATPACTPQGAIRPGRPSTASRSVPRCCC